MAKEKVYHNETAVKKEIKRLLDKHLWFHWAAAASWLRWPPNCCETCISWRKEQTHVGRCESPVSTHIATETDSRFRCQDFYRMTEEEREDHGQRTNHAESGG